MRYANIVSNGPHIWDDLMDAPRWMRDMAWIMVDEGGLRHPVPITHWVSARKNLFPDYVEQRMDIGYDMDFEAWSTEDTVTKPTAFRIHKVPGVEVPAMPPHGSELLAVKLAHHLGYDRVLLHGFANVRPKEPVYHFWRDLYEDFNPMVYSMSGWTKRIFGGPDALS